MSIARFQLPLEVANDQPWAQDFRFWTDRAKTQPASISGALAWLKAQNSASAALPLTAANGRIVLNGGIVGVRVAAADMSVVSPGAYDLELQATDASGGVRQVRGVVHVIAGLD